MTITEETNYCGQKYFALREDGYFITKINEDRLNKFIATGRSIDNEKDIISWLKYHNF